MPAIEPFEVLPERIKGLGKLFSAFVNALLIRECARARMRGYQLRIDYQDYTPDGGVDAELLDAVMTKWVPEGRSAWQFKSGDLEPNKCATELENAGWARTLIKEGAAYCLVLGAPLTAEKIEARLRGLWEKAKELGLIEDDQARIQVLDANSLARWASEYLSLALNRLVGGPGFLVNDYEQWSQSSVHQRNWMGFPDRENATEDIRRRLNDPDITSVRIQGFSGVGKTRLAMEALREENLQTLVVYVPEARFLSIEVMNYLLGDERTAILVVDDCGGRDHLKLLEQIPVGAPIKLVTIGEADYPLPIPALHIGPLLSSEVEEFLKANYLRLSTEAMHSIAVNCNGNPQFAIVLAERIMVIGEAQAGDLIKRNDIEKFVKEILPEGRDFFLSAVLALFKRIGWDRELRSQLERVAKFSNATIDELDQLGLKLESMGLLSRQGRYRAIGPHPVAVFFAAEAWRGVGNQLIDQLFPLLDYQMGLSLFERVADLGRYKPAQSLLRDLMLPEGPFGTLASIEEHNLAPFITQLAIVAPEDAVQHLTALIEAEPIENLRAQVRSRRDLVWSLEKLVWHRTTFILAANCLLRLALAENERYGNNATGIWLSLFATHLPATAATPEERLNYLDSCVSREREVILLVVKACESGLRLHESVMVSGELQGGAFVEERGGTKTEEEAAEYQSKLLEILGGLFLNEDEDVSTATRDLLIGSITSFIEDPNLGEKLNKILLRFDGKALHRLRIEIERLKGLYIRQEDKRMSTVLDKLSSELPQENKLEALRVLLELNQWDLNEEDALERISTSVQEIAALGEIEIALSWLAEAEYPMSWHLGRSLVELAGTDIPILDYLVRAAVINPSALVGFLQGLVAKGEDEAFDRFFDNPQAAELSPELQLLVTVIGPGTEAAKQRVFELIELLPVEQAVYNLFSWKDNLSEEDAKRLLVYWLKNTKSQKAFSALIDWLNYWLYRKDELPAELAEVSLQILSERQNYPQVGNQRWDWSHVASLLVKTNPLDIAIMILELIDSGELILLGSEDESELLRQASTLEPQEVWKEVVSRIEKGSWRIQMALRGWFTDAIPLEVLAGWIEESKERADIVASIARTGEDSPTPIARFLLENFGDSDEIKSSLAAEFVSGSWWGHWSDRIARQIEQLKGWQLEKGQSPEVIQWAARMITQLEEDRLRALEREAEEGY
jgi:hypothetical protein